MSIDNQNLFNVRIKNKYDTLDAWNSSNLVLEAGEIALAYTTTTGTNSSGTLVTHPAILMKVGDGVHKFNEVNPETSQPYLPWISAKAADVLSACKTTAGLTEFVTNVVNSLGIASDEAMQALTTRVGTAEGAIDALEKLVGTEAVSTQITNALNGYATESYADKAAKDAADGKDEAIAAAKKAGDDAAKALAEYKTANDALVNAKANASDVYTKDDIDAKDYATKAEAEAYANAKDSAITAAQNKADEAYNLAGTKVTAETGKRLITDAEAAKLADLKNYDDTALAGRVTAIENDYLVEADKTELEGKITANANAIELLTNGVSPDEVDSVNDLIEYVKEHGPEVTGMKNNIKTNTDAIAAINDTTSGILAQAKKYADDNDKDTTYTAGKGIAISASNEISNTGVLAITTGEEDGTIAVDGTDVAVKGLGSAAYKDEDYFDKANAAATAKSDVIGKSGDVASADTIYGAKKYADEKAAEAKQYADDNDANTTYSFNIPTEGDNKGKLVITPSEGKATTLDIATQSELNNALAEAKDYTDDEIAKLDGQVKVTEITDKSGYNVLTGVTQADGKLTSKTELKLSNLAVTGSTDDLVQGAKILVFDCGGSN